MAGLLDGKRLLITGVITDASIAFHVARVAQEQGAQVVLTGYGRLRLVERIAQRLPQPAPVLELDVADQTQLDSLAQRLGEHVDGLDGVLHSIAFAPASCLGGEFLNTPWADVATALQVSAYSFKSLTMGRSLTSAETVNAASMGRVDGGGNITFDSVYVRGSLDGNAQNDGTGIVFNGVNRLRKCARAAVGPLTTGSRGS